MKAPPRITGIGLLSAAGLGVRQTGRNLFEGQLTQVLDPAETRFWSLPVMDAWLEAADWKTLDLKPALMALVATQEALEMAGLSAEELKNLRVGVCLGSTVGCMNDQPEFADAYHRGERPDPRPLLECFNNNSAQILARTLGCQGPVQMVSNACTSGADAIGIAAGWLAQDLCDLVICGGSEIILPRMFYGFRSLMLCSPVACQPFDKSRQGLTLGEGAGILILEKNRTSRRGLAQLLGYGAGTDASHPTTPHPQVRGLQTAVNMALKMATKNLSQIDFINAHGTATNHNDLAEGRWIMQNVPQAKLVATKGYTGHTLGAAGAIEAALTVMSLVDQKLPISKGFFSTDPEIGVTPTQEIEVGIFRTALSFSLGFGGANSVLCLGVER